MIGQNVLKNQLLNLYTKGKLPKVCILLGPKGFGKKEFIKWFSQEVNIPYRFFTKDVDSKAIDIESIRKAINISQEEYTKIFYVFDKLEENKNKNIQNAILKFLEEPPQNINIFLLVENKNLLLPTILNRGVCFNFNAYTKEELRKFNNNELALDIFNSPGELIEVNKININNLIVDTDKIVDKLDMASLANALKLNSYIKINNKDEGLYDIHLFVKSLKYSFLKKYKETLDPTIKEKFKLLQQCIEYLKSNEKYFMDTFIIKNYLKKVK